MKKRCKQCKKETEFKLLIITRNKGKIYQCVKCGHKKQQKIKEGEDKRQI